MTSTTAPIRRTHQVAVSPLAFRRAPLGIAGWARILAPGALAGATIALTGSRRPGIGQLAAGVGVGSLTGLLLARGIDEVTWRSSAVSLEVDEPDAALDLMQAVRAEGVHADLVRADARGGRAAGSRPGGPYALRYRAKDDRRVRAVLAEQQG
jgi:hypothetical protein